MPTVNSRAPRTFLRAAFVGGVAVAIATWCGASASEDEDAAANKTPQTAATQIVSPSPPTVFGAGGNADPDVAAVVEIWKRLRGEQAEGKPDAEALADLLRQVKKKQASDRGPTAASGDEKPPQRYAEAYALSRELADKPIPTAQDDAQLIRLALIGHAWQTQYDVELVDRVAAIRKAARAIDKVAADLDEVDLYDRADQLFEQARSFRDEARQIRQAVVPTNDTYSASEVALAYNLHTLRAQIKLYQYEHHGRFPEVKPDGDGNPSLPQLFATTNVNGEIGTGPEYPHGPYMLSIPKNPLAPEETGHIIAEIDHWPPKEAVPRAGWFYHAPTGQIAPNAPGHFND